MYAYNYLLNLLVWSLGRFGAVKLDQEWLRVQYLCEHSAQQCWCGVSAWLCKLTVPPPCTRRALELEVKLASGSEEGAEKQESGPPITGGQRHCNWS